MNAQLQRIEEWEEVIAVPECAIEEVHENDRPLVQNAIYAIMACKHPERLCTSWGVSCTSTHYVVSAVLPEDFDVSLSDLEFIHTLNPLKISGISIVCTDSKKKLVVKILNHKQRVQLTEGELVVKQRKRKVWG